jgi:hypothetical protein
MSMRLLLLLMTSALLSSPAGALVSQRWDFPITEQQIRNGPEPDGSTESGASGFAHFAFDADTATLHYTITWRDLEGDLTKLHVHGPATPGQSNPNHLFEIFNSLQDVLDAEVDPRSDSFTGSIVLDDTATECTGLSSGTQEMAAADTLPCLLEGLAYVNVHTMVFPVGEIRGNVVLQPDVIVWAFDHGEEQVRNGTEPDGSTNSPGSGRGSFRYELVSGTLRYTITWADLEGDLTKLHVHGPAGPNEGNPNHLFEIFNSVQDVVDAGADPRNGSFTGRIALDPAATECTEEAGTALVAAPGTLSCLLEDRAYVNVHTQVDPMGEIRGNVQTQPVLLAWSFSISEDQVRNGTEPDGSTDSVGTGEGVLRYDVESGLLHYRIGWKDLEGDLTKLHIHGPAGREESNPNHLIEIFNSVQDVIDAGVDPRSDFVEGQIVLGVRETECGQEAALPNVAAPGTLPCFLEDRAYVNVHTMVDPTGEIRGNLQLVPHPYTWVFPISEDQVKNGNEADGSTNSPAAGEGVLRYDAGTQELAYEISWQGLEGGLTKLHVHGPAEAETSNANHLFEIFNTVQEIQDAGVDRFADTVFGSIQLERSTAACTDEPGTATVSAPGAFPCFLEERAYVNVHTEVDPTGEIRGNLLLVPEPSGWLLRLAALLATAYAVRLRASRATATSATSAPLEGSGRRRKVYVVRLSRRRMVVGAGIA